LSQEQLAARGNIHRTQISLLESGKRLPRLDTLVKIAGALEIQVEVLLVGIVFRPAKAMHGGFEISDRTARPLDNGEPGAGS
jgi:transcriptional regulator with XRE-family HTH domain